MKQNKILITIGIIFLVLLVWGLIGSSQSSKVGITCDFGIDSKGNVLCWKWHKNIVGDIQDAFNDLSKENITIKNEKQILEF